jgi:hypothetical protein
LIEKVSDFLFQVKPSPVPCLPGGTTPTINFVSPKKRNIIDKEQRSGRVSARSIKRKLMNDFEGEDSS